MLVVGSGGREHAIAKKLLESTNVEQVLWLPGNDGMRLDGLDLINIGISRTFLLIDLQKRMMLLGPSLVQMMPLQLVSWMISNAAGLKAFGPTRLRLSLSGLRILLRKSWSIRRSDSSLWHIFRFRGSQGPHRRKRRSIVVKADGLAPRQRCRRCGDS